MVANELGAVSSMQRRCSLADTLGALGAAVSVRWEVHRWGEGRVQTVPSYTNPPEGQMNRRELVTAIAEHVGAERKEVVPLQESGSDLGSGKLGVAVR